MHEGALVLWPQKESLYELMTMRVNMGEAAFNCEKQNDPRDPSKCEFDESWLEDCEYDSINATDLITVGFCDPAKGGETKKHDYSAIILLSYSPSLGKCFVTCDIKKRPVNVTIDAIINWCTVMKPYVFGCETNGFQELMAEEVVAKAPLAPIQGIENYGVHKNTRISRLSIWLQRKFFLFRRGCKDTKLLRQQLLDHPHASHDDGSDALESALRLLTSITDLQSDTVEVGSDDGLGDNIFTGNPYLQ